jgi:hypothetical protein
MDLVFICGALRSGTSLLHLVLDAHPEIANPGEFDFLFDGLTDLNEEPCVEKYTDFLNKNRIFQSKKLDINPSVSSYRDLINDLINQIKSRGVLSLNIHRNFDVAEYYFPHAKFLHVLRDPRDVSLSSIRMGWAGNAYHAVDHWVAAEKSWEKLASRASPNHLHEVKFEEFISDAKPILTKICHFLGVQYKPQMLNYHKDSTYDPIDVSLIEQWKKLAPSREIELIEAKAKGLIQRRGYELSFVDPRLPNMYEKFVLFLTNRIYRYRFSIRRYGLFLSVAQKLMTRWPMLPGAAWCRKRVHSIQLRHLK